MTHPDLPVLELMSPEPVTLHPDDTLRQAFDLLERYPFRHLPVVRGNELVGIVSDRDLFLATGTRYGRCGPFVHSDGRPRKIGEIMRPEVHTVPPEMTSRAAAKFLVAQRIGALPVVAGSALVGIVTETDLLNAYQRCSRWRAWCGGDEPVGDHMHSPVTTISSDRELLYAVQLCLDRDIRHLPVTDQGRLCGMLSDRDLRLGLARVMQADELIEEEGRREIPYLPVVKLMRTPVLSTSPESTLRSVTHTLLHERIGAMTVVHDGRLVGILSKTDLLRRYAALPQLAA